MALPYLLLRLVADFGRAPIWLMRSAEVGLGLSIVAIVFLPMPMAEAPALALVACFLAITGFDAWAFIAQARRAAGVTRRRLHAIADPRLPTGVGRIIGEARRLSALVLELSPGYAHGDLWEQTARVPM